MDSVDDWSDIGVLFSNKKLTVKQIIEGCGYKIEDLLECADSTIKGILTDSNIHMLFVPDFVHYPII